MVLRLFRLNWMLNLVVGECLLLKGRSSFRWWCWIRWLCGCCCWMLLRSRGLIRCWRLWLLSSGWSNLFWLNCFRRNLVFWFWKFFLRRFCNLLLIMWSCLLIVVFMLLIRLLCFCYWCFCWRDWRWCRFGMMWRLNLLNIICCWIWWWVWLMCWWCCCSLLSKLLCCWLMLCLLCLCRVWFVLIILRRVSFCLFWGMMWIVWWRRCLCKDEWGSRCRMWLVRFWLRVVLRWSLIWCLRFWW